MIVTQSLGECLAQNGHNAMLDLTILFPSLSNINFIVYIITV